jgi:protein SCO1/2
MTDSSKTKKHSKVVVIILLDVIIITALIFYFGIIRPQQQWKNTHKIKIDGTYLTTATEIKDFQLTDNHDKPFTKDNLKGRWTMMFFGFTNCGMVCPTTMDALNKMYHLLQKDLPAEKMPQVLFVSVDPDRDTVERINDYMMSFNPSFIGARSDIAATVALEKQLHIVAAKLQVDGQGKNQYTINHSAEILLFNPEAKVQAYFSFPHEPEQMAKDYKTILQNTKV